MRRNRTILCYEQKYVHRRCVGRHCDREEREQAREALRRQEGQGRLQRLERLSRPIPESILTLLPTLPPDECAAILRAYRGITTPPEAA